MTETLSVDFDKIQGRWEYYPVFSKYDDGLAYYYVLLLGSPEKFVCTRTAVNAFGAITSEPFIVVSPLKSNHTDVWTHIKSVVTSGAHIIYKSDAQDKPLDWNSITLWYDHDDRDNIHDTLCTHQENIEMPMRVGFTWNTRYFGVDYKHQHSGEECARGLCRTNNTSTPVVHRCLVGCHIRPPHGPHEWRWVDLFMCKDCIESYDGHRIAGYDVSDALDGVM
jgi:hypothetical protein